MRTADFKRYISKKVGFADLEDKFGNDTYENAFGIYNTDKTHRNCPAWFEDRIKPQPVKIVYVRWGTKWQPVGVMCEGCLQVRHFRECIIIGKF